MAVGRGRPGAALPRGCRPRSRLLLRLLLLCCGCSHLALKSREHPRAWLLVRQLQQRLPGGAAGLSVDWEASGQLRRREHG